MGNVAIEPLRKHSIFRKIAMGTWATAKDPSVYGLLELDVTKALEQVESYQAKHNLKITPAHMIGRALAYCMKKRPEINGIIRWKKIYLRKNVSLFYQVNMPGEGKDKIKKADLAGAVLHKAEFMTVAEIAKNLRDKANKLRSGEDKEIKNNMNLFKLIPWSLVGCYLDFVSWILYGLNLNLSFLGVPRDPFGSVMITNVGSLGIDIAWAPLVPYSRVPLLLTVGAVQDKAVVVEGSIQIRKILSIGITFDHRLVDGVHAAEMAKDFKAFFANPTEFLFNDNLAVPESH